MEKNILLATHEETAVPAIANSGESSQPQSQQPERQQHASTIIIGWILQGGVLISAAVVIFGLLIFFIRPGGATVASLLAFPRSMPQLWDALRQFQPEALITVGLLLLIATPVIRVAASIVTFALEHDRTYVVITTLVLLILLLSIFCASGTDTAQPASAFGLRFAYTDMLFIFLGAIIAGLLGSLVGLGGGVLIVPMLTLLFHLPITIAIGASIISVIATSSGAAAAYVRDHMTNMRVGMFLELGTTIGAISGAFIAGLLAPNLLAIIFGIILVISAAPLLFKIGEELPQGVKNDRWANWLHLASTYPDRRQGKEVAYEVTRTPFGLGMMYLAGAISGLLGIGSGTFKVVALDTLMRLPLKVSTTTSNFMIGVTAAASAGIYFSRGDIPPLVAAPVALGILAGALLGARLLPRISNKLLRILFLIVMLISAVEMILHGAGIGAF